VSSIHAAPAAYPRQLREAHGTNGWDSSPFGTRPIPPKESKGAAAARWEAETTCVVQKRYDAREWTLDEAREARPLKQWLGVERWRRTSASGAGYTIVCTHAGGLIKEVRSKTGESARLTEKHWHKIMRGVLARTPSSPAVRFGSGERIQHAYSVEIDEIWFIDDLNHALSFELNAGRMGDVQTWEDGGRDVLNFIQHVLPLTASESEAAWELGWTPVPTAPRKVIGVGHSFGGAALIAAAHAAPSLFHGLFLVDPMAVPMYFAKYLYYHRALDGFPLSQACLKRRSSWPSRDAARKILLESPFFAAWDRDQFETYLLRGIIPRDPSKPDGEVVLATPPWSEATVFTEPDASARTWDRLPGLEVPVGWCMAGDSYTTRGDATTQETVWRPPRARNERIMRAGHLATQETPVEVADSLWRFLCTLQAGEWDELDMYGAKL